MGTDVSVTLSVIEESHVRLPHALREMSRQAPLDLRNERKYGWNVYFCCVKETGQPTAR